MALRLRLRLLLAALLLLLPGGCGEAGLAAPFPRAGVATPEADEGGPAFTCLAEAPSLAWYLDGAENDGAGSQEQRQGEGAAGEGLRRVTVRRLDRRLNCSAVDPATGHESSAAVVLHVQFQPELVQLEARSEAGRPPGLLLVLLVLVQASPAARITWVDPDGRLMVNTSHFLIVDTHTYPWLGRHTLEVQLRAWARNASRDAPGANASALLPGFLEMHVELPLLALLVGAAVALLVLVVLAASFSYLVYQKGKKAAGLAQPAQLPASNPNHLMPQGPRLPRASTSLPSNLQFHDLTLEPKADGVEDEEGAHSEPENNLVLEHRGLAHFPLVGYIYKASSVSSEEIWL